MSSELPLSVSFSCSLEAGLLQASNQTCSGHDRLASISGSSFTAKRIPLSVPHFFCEVRPDALKFGADFLLYDGAPSEAGQDGNFVTGRDLGDLS